MGDTSGKGDRFWVLGDREKQFKVASSMFKIKCEGISWKDPESLSRLSEHFISLFQKILIRFKAVCDRHDSQASVVALLQAVSEHGAAGFVQNVLSDLNPQVGSNAEDVAVESAVMELAERKAI